MKTYLLALIACLVSVCHGAYLGSWDIDDYVTITATTHRFSTGNAYAATGDVTLDVYEDDTDVQIVTTTMAAFDSVTGLYAKKIQLLAATGFEAGKHYTVLIKATVDGVSGIATDNFQINAKVNSVKVGGEAISSLADVADAVAAEVGTKSGLIGDWDPASYSLEAISDSILPPPPASSDDIIQKCSVISGTWTVTQFDIGVVGEVPTNFFRDSMMYVKYGVGSPLYPQGQWTRITRSSAWVLGEITVNVNPALAGIPALGDEVYIVNWGFRVMDLPGGRFP